RETEGRRRRRRRTALGERRAREHDRRESQDVAQDRPDSSLQSHVYGMGALVGRIRSLALALGGPGLFLVAFLDSTFLPLPGITDLLLVIMVTRRPSAMLAYVLLTVAGSVAGCVVMLAIGRGGGGALR